MSKSARPTLEQALKAEAGRFVNTFAGKIARLPAKDQAAIKALIAKHRRGESGAKSWRALARAVQSVYGIEGLPRSLADYLAGYE